ncbi:MAG: TIGR03619 family F420-dependent LLM class oxidoreductase [Dehalococcoidia bacterium]|nr:TIGR03619 family F420-dependent LLM class oxidoreductase [Dehalococcoidia bacterium]
MQVGVVFPQTEIGADPSGVRDYVLAAEAAGYDHLLAYDHVLGADPERPGGFRGPYTHETLFHEPLVLFGYMAALTQRIELVTGILILPQRQTALVAKQAAEIDVLSGGRLRLGVGVGWNAVEYEALGENFRNRGRRIEEQIAVLRALWGDQVVTFEGKYHCVTLAGIKPLPPRPAIPIWMGGMSEPVLERVGRLADGWFPQLRDPADLAARLERIHAAAEAAGRDPASIGIEPRVAVTRENVDQAVELSHRWAEAGATHLTVNTMGAGFETPGDHIRAIESFRGASTAGSRA